jgi:hypothetical protein
MELNLKIIGILLIALAFVHCIFPKYFNWKKELIHLSLINRQMMTIHTFFIALTVFLMGLLCLVASYDLVNTKLGKLISIGLGLFWTCRLIIQFFGYSKDLWKGKQLETGIHILFAIVWLYLSTIFIWIGIS